MGNSAIICDEVIKSYDKEIKNFMKEIQLIKHKVSLPFYFTCLFINHHYIIDSC